MIKRGLSRLGTFFLYLLSLLPFRCLYLLADFLFLVLYHITKYRRKVVQDNLLSSFPEKLQMEREAIEKKYYKFLADLIVETVKAISISQKEVIKRMASPNPEIIDEYLSKGRNVVIVTGHYCNWELAALRVSMETVNKRFIVYKPQSNLVFNNFFNNTRGRFGATLIAMKETFRKLIQHRNEPTVSILLSDQTPAKSEAVYFTPFLNRPAAVFLGIEKLSKAMDAVVVFCKIEPLKRGYYKGTLIPLVEEPKATEPYEITTLHVNYLEKMIRERPEYWLWSHRRWKIKPEDVQQ